MSKIADADEIRKSLSLRRSFFVQVSVNSWMAFLVRLERSTKYTNYNEIDLRLDFITGASNHNVDMGGKEICAEYGCP